MLKSVYTLDSVWVFPGIVLSTSVIFTYVLCFCNSKSELQKKKKKDRQRS